MKVIALDQATGITGVAKFEGTALREVAAIDYHKMKKPEERKAAMAMGIIEELEAYQPDKVVIEDVSFQKNAASLIDLARLQGVILGWCFKNQKDIMIYKPSAWRKALQFKQGSRVNRAELKRQAREYVKLHYHLDVNEDEADAVCIGCADTQLNLRQD